MTPSLSLGLKIFLLISGVFHFIQVIAMVGFSGFLKQRSMSSCEWTPESELGKAIRRGLILFVVGSGILVLLNLSEILRGGGLAISLCVLLSCIFGYRWFLQLFCFSKFLKLGASRYAHWCLILGSGIASITYAICAVILVMV